jgi:hypothetical protein
MIWPPEIESARALARLDKGVDQVPDSDASSQRTVREQHLTTVARRPRGVTVRARVGTATSRPARPFSSDDSV